MNGPVSDKPRTMRRLIWVALGAVLIVLAVALASEDAGWKVLGYLVYLLILVLTNPKAAAVAAVCLLLAWWPCWHAAAPCAGPPQGCS